MMGLGIVTPMLFPDWPRFLLILVFCSCIFGAAFFTLMPVLLYRLKRARLYSIGGGVIMLAAAWWFWPTDIFNTSMPGLTISMRQRLFDTPEQNDRTLFIMKNDRGAEARLYLSASGLFTFSVKDVYRSIYNLEAKLYRSEIPVDTEAAIFCEIAIGKHESVLRIMVDKKEARRRTIPAALVLGDENWKPQLGGGAVFALQEAFAFKKALTNQEVDRIVDNQIQYYNP
jgi:hypothetical protein